MGWSTKLFCNISFNRETFNSKIEVQDKIEEIETYIQNAKDRLRDLLMMTEPGKFCPENYDPLIWMRNEFQERMEHYDMVKQEVTPQNETTVRKYQKQCLYTDTGIEIKIPMERYKDSNSVEFITNPDGTVSVLIKNIEHLAAKY